MEKIKIVIWDLDDTIWNGTLMENEMVVPNWHIINFIKILNDRGIVNSICSKNELFKAKKELEKLGIWSEFVNPIIEYGSKGRMIQRLLNDLHLRATNALFVDDNLANLEEVKYYNNGIKICLPSYLTNEMLEKEEFAGYFEGRRKINQYMIIQKKNEAKNWVNDNREFLLNSNIKITLIDYDNIYFQRVFDLINKTNQLNFTKIRMGKEELDEMLVDKRYKTTLCLVNDSFGDYGIVGLYTITEKRLFHFVFSCRIMDMGIENYLYNYLGRPQINVIGDVAGDLSIDEEIDWITIDEHKTRKENTDIFDMSIQKILKEQSKINIFGIGACDLLRAISFFDGFNHNLKYECNEFKGMERGVNVGTEYIRSIFDMTENNKNYCKEHFYNYTGDRVFSTDIFNNNNDYIIMSFHDDMVFKIYTNKKDPNLRVLRSPNPYFGLTSIIMDGKMLSHDSESTWLKYNGFDEGYFISVDRFRENMIWISENIPQGIKLFLITGPEYPYFRNNKKLIPEVHEQIKVINKEIRQLCENNSDKFVLIDINDIVVDRTCFTDYVFHLTSLSSWKLYNLIIKKIIKNGKKRKPSIFQSYIGGEKTICIIGDGNDMIQARNTIELSGDIVANVISVVDFIIDNKIDSNQYYVLVNYNRKVVNILEEHNCNPVKDFIILNGRISNEVLDISESDYIDELIHDNYIENDIYDIDSITWSYVKI